MKLPVLDNECTNCKGEGFFQGADTTEPVECMECHGVGWVPTEEGRTLLDFLQRHLIIELEEEDEDEDEE
jgi:DnaJ-class molecular chaperone